MRRLLCPGPGRAQTASARTISCRLRHCYATARSSRIRSCRWSLGCYTLSDSTFRFEKDESIYGRTICIPLDQDASALNDDGRNWLSEKRVATVRQPTLPDCVSAVQKLEADAFLANDLEGRYVLQRLGLTQHFKMAERPLGTRGIHAIALKENPQALALIQSVNLGLKQLKQTDAYGAIVRKHLMRLWDIKSTQQ